MRPSLPVCAPKSFSSRAREARDGLSLCLTLYTLLGDPFYATYSGFRSCAENAPAPTAESAWLRKSGVSGLGIRRQNDCSGVGPRGGICIPTTIIEEPRKIANGASLVIASRYVPASQTQKARKYLRICSRARIPLRMTRNPPPRRPQADEWSNSVQLGRRKSGGNGDMHRQISDEIRSESRTAS
jgi:hypothetical protein